MPVPQQPCPRGTLSTTRLFPPQAQSTKLRIDNALTSGPPSNEGWNCSIRQVSDESPPLRPNYRQVFSMDAGTVRCPFCVADNDFRRMIPVSENRFACVSCCHVTAPKDEAFQCQCLRCIGLRELARFSFQQLGCSKKEQQNAQGVRKAPTLR